MGRRPADSGQLSLDPAHGLALPLPPPRQQGSPDPVSGFVLAHFSSLRSLGELRPLHVGQDRACAASGKPPAILGMGAELRLQTPSTHTKFPFGP